MTDSEDKLNIHPNHPENKPPHQTEAEAARAKIANIGDYQPVSPDLLTLLGQSVGNVTHVLSEIVELPPRPEEPTATTAPEPAKKNLTWHQRWRPAINAVVFFVAIFALFKAPVIVSQIRYKMDPPKKAAPVVTPANQTQESKLTIPKINVSTPIIFEPSLAEPAIQNSLRNGVVHYASTAKPGEPGNSVIVGHSSNDWWEPGNYKFVFVLLDKLVSGDKISISYQGRYYVYEVYESRVVEPTDLSVLAQTNTNELTLLTCTPPGTSWKRLIVKAKQVSPKPRSSEQIAHSSQSDKIFQLPGNAPGIGDQLSRFWKNITKVFAGRT